MPHCGASPAMIIALSPRLLPSGKLKELRRQSLVPRGDAVFAIIIMSSSLLLPCGVRLSWGGGHGGAAAGTRLLVCHRVKAQAGTYMLYGCCWEVLEETL